MVDRRRKWVFTPAEQAQRSTITLYWDNNFHLCPWRKNVAIAIKISPSTKTYENQILTLEKSYTTEVMWRLLELSDTEAQMPKLQKIAYSGVRRTPLSQLCHHPASVIGLAQTPKKITPLPLLCRQPAKRLQEQHPENKGRFSPWRNKGCLHDLSLLTIMFMCC